MLRAKLKKNGRKTKGFILFYAQKRYFIQNFKNKEYKTKNILISCILKLFYLSLQMKTNNYDAKSRGLYSEEAEKRSE